MPFPGYFDLLRVKKRFLLNLIHAAYISGLLSAWQINKFIQYLHKLK